MKRAAVIGSLVLALAFIFLLPGADAHRILPTAAVVLLVCAVAMAFARAWVEVGTIALIAAMLGVVHASHAPGADPSTVLLRWGSISGFLLLSITLLIGPWARFTRRAVPLLRARRHVGVTTYLLALLHVALVMRLYLQSRPQEMLGLPFYFLGYTGFFILSLLALTSWDFFQLRMKRGWWLALHIVAFLWYLTAFATFVSQTAVPPTTAQWAALAGGLVLWALFAPWGLAPKIVKHLTMWKQLHRLIWIAYLAVVAHAASGPLALAAPAVRILFWAIVAFVIGSHAYGLRRAARPRTAR